VVTHHAAALVRRPVDVVTAYVFDPRTMPHWSGVLFAIEPVDDVEPRVGRRLRAELKVLGVRLTVEGELLDADLEERRATVRIVPLDGDGAIEHRLWVEPSGDGAVVHFWNRIEPPGWLAGAVSDQLVEAFVEHTARFALDNIRAILENGDEDAVAGLTGPAG
jgi:uncharacterized membrane protein